MPSLLERAHNLADAMSGVVEHYQKTGKVVATRDLMATRRAACHTCEHFTGRVCRVCGCMIEGKIALQSSSCPLDPPKW